MPRETSCSSAAASKAWAFWSAAEMPRLAAPRWRCGVGERVRMVALAVVLAVAMVVPVY